MACVDCKAEFEVQEGEARCPPCQADYRVRLSNALNSPDENIRAWADRVIWASKPKEDTTDRMIRAMAAKLKRF